MARTSLRSLRIAQPGPPPRAIDLGEAAPIDALVATWRDALQGRDIEANHHARVLDARVMAPIRALLGDAEDIFLAPDGDLNLIPFAALVDEHDRFLVERYHITYLTSGRDLLRFDSPDPAREASVIVADPRYGTFPREAPPGHVGNLLDRKVEPLPGTAREARTLAMLLPNPRVWTGAEATEARVAQLHGPATLHIATHGLWLPDVPDTQQQDAARMPDDTRGFAMRTPPPGLARTFDPMLRSGLVLAGFNTGGTGADANDDGFLSALEMTSLDLHGTRLVALSACETGVGEVKSGQGVYGMRRALVLAGAQTQVMSLWKVSDSATAYIMEAYYTKLREGAGRGEAMRQVQLELLEDPMRRAPFHWASFIVSGDPAPLYAEPLDPPDHPGSVAPTGGCACDSVARTPHLPTAVLLLLAFLVARRGRRVR